MKHNRIAMMAFILIQLFAGASQLKAQFRIVDEQDGKPVSGAYVFSSKGTLLCISDADGNVKAAGRYGDDQQPRLRTADG